jgi:flagellum-specific peptidoglycan hydrolase FlgJ
MIKRYSIHLLLIFALLSGFAGKAQITPYSTQVQNYIDGYCQLAMAEQQRTGIPASIKLAQAVLESGAGNGDLAIRSNNHFGIKCKKNWTGATTFHDDDARGECFRAYDSVSFSFRDHSDFLRAGAHYEFLFQLDITDYKAWAIGLKKAGYATNPRYPDKLIGIIETYNLQSYTLLAIQNLSVQEATSVILHNTIQAQ